MTRSLGVAIAIAAAAALGACAKPNVAKCSQNADCPANAVCVSGICQKGVPSGGARPEPIAGSAHVTSGTLTMDAIVGQPAAPTGSSGTRTLKPAQNTR